MRDNLASALRLLLVTDDAVLAGRDPVEHCLRALDGGVTAVQLRFKRPPDADLLATGRRLRDALRPRGIPLFVNDRLDLALLLDADGVHLGPDDLPPAVARRLAPAAMAIGASVGRAEEIARAASADYWGIGPLHGTGTKGDAGAPLGWAGVVALLRAAEGRPCVVIGGVRPEDVPSARAEGFAGVAVVSGILAAADPALAARRYAEA